MGGRAPGPRARVRLPLAARSARTASSVSTVVSAAAMPSTSRGSTMQRGRRTRLIEVDHAGHFVGDHRRRAHPHGLERRQPVALGQRDVGEGPGAPVEATERGVAAPLRRRPRPPGPSGSVRTGPHPVGPTITSGHGSGRVGRARGVRLQQPVDVLAGLERAHGQEELPRHAESLQQGIGLRRVLGAPGDRSRRGRW